jgi:hypothetical protein
MKASLKFAAGLFATALIASPAHASVVVQIAQDATDVVATVSGSLSTSGLTFYGAYGLSSFLRPQVAVFSMGGLGDEYVGVTGPSSFGTGGMVSQTGQSGDLFTLFGSGNRFAVPHNYVSGTPISSTVTYANQTIASLGLTPGEYVYTTPNDTITVQIAAPSVPEPATWALMILGFGAVGAELRRRSRDALA